MPTGTIFVNHPLFLLKVRYRNKETRTFLDRLLVYSTSAESPENQVHLANEAMGKGLQDPSGAHIYLGKLKIDEKESARLIIASRMSPQRRNSHSIYGYFEDRSGNPLERVELIADLTGQPDPVLLDNLNRMTSLSHPSIKRGETLTQDESNDVIHFIQSMRIIQCGRWWQHTLAISSESGVDCADLDSTVCALALIRQFFVQRDKSFQKSVEIYRRVVGDSRKATWAEIEFYQFNAQLKKVPFGVVGPMAGPLQKLNCEELINYFVYGTGLFHRRSDKSLEDKLAVLSQQVSREGLAYGFHSACRDVLISPLRVANVLYADFANWIDTRVCPKPNRVVVENLFKSSLFSRIDSET